MKTPPTEKKLKQRQYFASASLFGIGAKQNRNKFPKKVPLGFFFFSKTRVTSCHVVSACLAAILIWQNLTEKCQKFRVPAWQFCHLMSGIAVYLCFALHSCCRDGLIQ